MLTAQNKHTVEADSSFTPRQEPHACLFVGSDEAQLCLQTVRSPTDSGADWFLSWTRLQLIGSSWSEAAVNLSCFYLFTSLSLCGENDRRQIRLSRLQF